MTAEEQIRKFINDLAELDRYNQKNYLSMPGGYMEKDLEGRYVLLQDIEVLLKQTFRDEPA